jgi:predicted phage tail component-like protein
VTTNVTYAGVSLASAVPEAAITRVRRTLLGSRRDQYVDVAGQPGSWLFADEPGDRTVSLDVHIHAATYAQRRTAVLALAQWADSSSAQQLIIDDAPDRYWSAKLASAPDPEEWLGAADLTLEFRTGPYAQALTPTTVTWTAVSGQAYTLTAAVDVPVQPVVTLTAAYGAVAGNANATGSLTWRGKALTGLPQMTAGSSVTINSLAYMVTAGVNADTGLTGYFDATATAPMAKLNGTFPTVTAGAQTVTWQAPAGSSASVDVSAVWRQLYR